MNSPSSSSSSSSSSTAAMAATATTSSSRRSAIVIAAFTCFLILICVQQTSGLRGCSSFGHSCFGAHGKRADDVDVDDDVTNYEPLRMDMAVQHRPPLSSPTTSSSSSSSLSSASSQPQSPNIAKGRRRIPFALLQLLRNLAEDIDDPTAAENRMK